MPRFGSALGLLVLLAACGPSGGGVPAGVTGVSVFRTPGKDPALFDPSEPAERIAARSAGGRAWLEVHVNLRREDVTAPAAARAELDADEWRAVLDLVREGRLLEWRPQEGAAPADWGSGGVRIEGSEPVEWRWRSPPTNGAPVERLSRHLARLAREKLPTPPLHYLTP
jgi:hypothetical protein